MRRLTGREVAGIAWCLAGLVAVRAAPAAEGGSTEYVGGYTAFASGYTPPDPGSYLTNELYYYTASVTRLAVQGRLALNVSTDIYFDTAQLTQMTALHLLGATYGFGIALPGGYVDVSGSITPPGVTRRTATSGLGDLFLMPLLLGWHRDDWYGNLALSVFAPTGQYNPAQPVSLSKHFWAVDASMSGSWLTQSGFDLSASLGYTVNFENPDTHYRSGDVVHLDLALGQNLTRSFKIGLAAYAVVQVSGDSGAGAILGPFRSDIYGAGPAAEYDTSVHRHEMSLQLRGYREFDARNHLAGKAAYLTLDLKL